MGIKKRSTAEEQFGERLRTAMRRKFMDIKTLGRAVGVSYEMARRYCGGVAIPREPERLRRMAIALEVEVDWLLEGVGPGPVGAPAKRIPYVKLSDADISFDVAKWTGATVSPPAGLENGIAVEITAPLGAEWKCRCGSPEMHLTASLFKRGDVVFVRPAEHDGDLPSDARVLIEAKRKADGGRRYFVRRVKYMKAEPFEVIFCSEEPEKFPDLKPKDYKVIGVVEALLARI